MPRQWRALTKEMSRAKVLHYSSDHFVNQFAMDSDMPSRDI